MKEFALLFRHENATGQVSPEQMEQWMQQQMEWISGIEAQHKYVGGTGLLFDAARVVGYDGVVTNGPFGDIKETLGGYVVVRADNVDEAVAFAKGAPVLQGPGNTVEVREIAQH